MTEKIWMTLIICLSILYFTVAVTTTIEEVFKIIYHKGDKDEL